MSDLISRRGIMASIAAALLAPLTAKVRTALARGRASETEVAAASGGPQETAAWRYDDCARPEADDVQQVTTYCYDDTGRLISVIEPREPVVTTFVYKP